MKRRTRALAVLLLLVAVALTGAYFYFQRQLGVVHTPPAPATPFEIPSGLGARGVIRLLRERGIIPDENLAMAYLVWSGDRGKLKAGEYLFDKPMTVPEVVGKLVRGSVVLHRFTVVEGLTLAETAGEWEEQGFGKSEDFLSAAGNAADLVRDFAPQGASIEGYLFPETYSFPIRTTPRQAIAAMIARFRNVVEKAKKANPTDQWPLNLRDTVILASLIETEAQHDEERPVIASVYLNRLKRKILLQCDPTVIYALERVNRYQGRLTNADLKFDSPYNTYRYAGLPPGPIASPGKRSLEAAIRPASSPYIFFVRTVEGRHTFSATLSEHNRAVSQYRAMVRSARK